MADSLVVSVIPLPVVLTLTFPLWTDADWFVLVPLEGSPDPPGERPEPPPDDAQPLVGNASAAKAGTHTA
jgi:hypothetical protein